ncbi:MAG: serine/threonine protein kinase, partial [Planctomycetota bacterium]
MNFQEEYTFLLGQQWFSKEELDQLARYYNSHYPQLDFLEFLVRSRRLDPQKYRQALYYFQSKGKTSPAFTGSASPETRRPGQPGTLAPSHGEPHNHAMIAGRYRLEKILGQGGMGKVYLGVDTFLKRRVAIKINIMQEKDQSRFLKEAQIISQLDHPYIVPIFDIGKTQDGQIYICTKYIEGVDLSHVIEDLKNGRESAFTTIPRRLELFLKVLEAVSYAHSKLIVHRDLKPQNIMVGFHGEVWTLDWGLAKVLDESESASTTDSTMNLDLLKEIVNTNTMDGTMAGTPGYMAPEQAYGEQKKIGPQSDIFSLGVILYQLLTLEEPFQGKTLLEVMMKTTQGEFLPPRAVNPSLPKPLEAIILKAMKNKRWERYLSVEDFIRDIRGYLENKPISVYSPSFYEKSILFLRNQAPLLAGLAMVLAFISLVSILVLQTEKSKRLAESKAKAALKKQFTLEKQKRILAERMKKEAADKQKAIEAKLKAERERKKLKEEQEKKWKRRFEALKFYWAARDILMRNMKFKTIKEEVIP